MPSFEEVEALAMQLSEHERELLARRLSTTLPVDFIYDEEGMAEALRRDKEMDADPSLCITLDELKRAVGR